jgi:hypothetical protein
VLSESARSDAENTKTRSGGWEIESTVGSDMAGLSHNVNADREGRLKLVPVELQVGVALERGELEAPAFALD